MTLKRETNPSNLSAKGPPTWVAFFSLLLALLSSFAALVEFSLYGPITTEQWRLTFSTSIPVASSAAKMEMLSSLSGLLDSLAGQLLCAGAGQAIVALTYLFVASII